MRLIDADALKYKNVAEVNGYLTHILTAEEINNAPTVTPSLNLDNITDEDVEKFKMIWQRATGKGLCVIHEERQPDIQMGGWIPVSERLPEQGNTSYLVTVDYGDITFSCQRFFYNAEIGWNDDSVIAWQPLPEPYCVEGNV